MREDWGAAARITDPDGYELYLFQTAGVVSVEDYTKPILAGEGASDYERYLRTDELLSLQRRPEEQAHRDELLFQTVHQASELWLKLAWTEVEEATRLIERGELAPGRAAPARARTCVSITSSASSRCSSRCRPGSTRRSAGARPRERLRLAGLPSRSGA